MKLEIKKFKTHGSAVGYVASFDVVFDDLGLVVRGMSLLRPERAPNEGWLVIPDLVKTGRHSVGLLPHLREEIAERALKMYEAAKGLRLQYVSPDAGLDDDSGLRRVLSAEAETCVRAGL